MNRIAKITIAAAFSSLALAGASQAQGIAMNTSPDIEQSLRSFRGDNFNVEPIHDYSSAGRDEMTHISAPERSMRAVHAIQASIQANRPLARELNAQGFRVHNVVNAEEAADGSMTFYVR